MASTESDPTAAKSSGKGKPRKARSKKRFESRRHEIVDTAARLFAERGYHATSVEDLSEATGLQRGGLYHYIGSKEELLFQIHERFIEPLLAEATAIEERGDDPEETLRALARALMHDISTYQDQVTVFLHEWKSVAAHHERAAKIREQRTAFEAVVERTLRRGTAQGVFEIADSRLAVLAFLGMINYSYQWFRAGSDDAEVVADTFSGYFLSGIRAPQHPAPES